MSHKARCLFWPLMLWCLGTAPAGAAEYWNFKTAYDAYDRGEFQLAADIYKRLADKGNVRAQNELGFLYSVGQGVPQDFKIAASWYRQAADQGYAPALLHLARLYETGRGVAKNVLEAHKLYSLGALLTEKANQRQIALSQITSLAARMTPVQLAAARKRACLWWRAHRETVTAGGRALPYCRAE